MKKQFLLKSSVVIFLLCLSACQHYVDPNASVDGVIGTVGGAFENINGVGKK